MVFTARGRPLESLAKLENRFEKKPTSQSKQFLPQVFELVAANLILIWEKDCNEAHVFDAYNYLGYAQHFRERHGYTADAPWVSFIKAYQDRVAGFSPESLTAAQVTGTMMSDIDAGLNLLRICGEAKARIPAERGKQ
jgi:hypothetical protein